MLLRVRVELPDRPGSLGQVARTLGVAGADIVQVVVLERMGGRAVDDFTVMWPSSSTVDRVLAGLSAVPGVRVDGIWRANELTEPSGRDVAVIGQIATNPDHGLATLVDAVPGMFAADWAAVAQVGTDWPAGEPAEVICASWSAPQPLSIGDLTPLRPRALTNMEGVHLAVAPFKRAGLVMVVARGGAPAPDDLNLYAPPFERGEVDQLAQLVESVSAVLAGRLDSLRERPATPSIGTRTA